jgi:hypothetical protein
LALQSGREYVPQAGDEYGKGIVSAPATAVARIASAFKNTPFIGKFATATEMGASAVSAIARLFGFTNVPVVSDAQPVKVLCFPNLSTVDVGYPTEKLTMDSKNELSIDPTVVGLSQDDELTISSIAMRESYLTTTTWATSNNVDDILFSSAVGPMLFDNDNATNAKLYMTPVCLAAQMFNEWRGDIIFRFRFICSQYHKGRVRFSFDPSGYSGDNLTNDANSTNVVFTQIVDMEGF